MDQKLGPAEIRKTIGKKIKTLREINNMTQVDLAKAVGMTSTGAISQIENATKGIKLQAVIRVAAALNVHPIVLLDMNGLTKDELSLMVGLMKLIKKRKEDPAAVGPHIDAITKLLGD